MRTLLLHCALVLLAAATVMPAAADEPDVHLKPGPGLDKVEGNCGACHTLEYIQMNSPFLNAKGWEAEVTKMRKGYNAPISDADAKAIVDYLAANYGSGT